MIDWLVRFEQRVNAAWEHLGTHITSSGVRCVGHVPQVGRAAWLHRFYPGCPAAELDAAEERMGFPIPPEWREVLLVLNGLGLFITKVSLCGVLPGNRMQRVIEDPRPFSLENANTLERPHGPAVASNDFVIGGSSAGDAALYVLRENESLLKVTRRGDAELGAWGSLSEMLEDQYSAMAKRHDTQGTYDRDRD